MWVGGQRHAPAALPRERLGTQLYKRLGGPQGRSGRVRKISHKPGFELRTVQPVEIRYTEWVIPAHNCEYITYLLTLWCRVLLEQLTGLQLVKKFPAFHGTRRFITALTTVRKLSLSWASPIQSIYPHPTSWRSILILSIHPRLVLPSGLLPSGFPTKTLYTPSPNPYVPHAQPSPFCKYITNQNILTRPTEDDFCTVSSGNFRTYEKKIAQTRELIFL